MIDFVRKGSGLRDRYNRENEAGLLELEEIGARRLGQHHREVFAPLLNRLKLPPKR